MFHFWQSLSIEISLKCKRQREYTIDKRHGCELRDSLNFAHSQKISFIRRQAYSLFDLASALASNNLWERHLGAAGVHRTSASGCVPTGPTTHTLIAYCDMLILKAKNGRAVEVHTVS
jgi:hypothetical protein